MMSRIVSASPPHGPSETLSATCSASSTNGRHSHNLDQLGFIDALDDKYVRFGWIFQQDETTYHTIQESLGS
jgi:hypothetical protein